MYYLKITVIISNLCDLTLLTWPFKFTFSENSTAWLNKSMQNNVIFNKNKIWSTKSFQGINKVFSCLQDESGHSTNNLLQVLENLGETEHWNLKVCILLQIIWLAELKMHFALFLLTIYWRTDAKTTSLLITFCFVMLENK